MITEWEFRALDKYPERIICSDGSIYNSKGKKMSLKIGKGGYLRCRMYGKNKEWYSWVHRMVGYAFLGDCEGLEVHHNNRNRKDNRAVNLKKMTKKENLDLREWNNPVEQNCPF